MAHLPDSVSALYAGRAMLALLSANLLTIMVAASWSRPVGPLSLLGVAVATTPMVLFLGTVLDANGVKVAGALASFAVALRSARRNPPRWLWLAGAVAAAATVLAHPTGLVWLAVAVALALARDGPRATVAAVRQPRSRWAAVLVATAVAATLTWDRTVQPYPTLDLGVAARSLHDLLDDLLRMAKEWIGVFGWASVPMTPRGLH